MLLYKGEKEKKEDMELKSRISVISLVLLLMAISNVIPMGSAPVIDPPVVPEGVGDPPAPEKFGPRVNDLLFIVCGDVLKESMALQNGEIDAMDWAAPGAYVDPWLYDSDITMGDYSEWGFYEFDINNQMWPIGHGGQPESDYVDWTMPDNYAHGHNVSDPDLYWIDYSCQRCLDAREFRRALAHLVDRDAMSAHMMGFAGMMETFIFPGIASWENPAAQRYPYNPTTAATLLYNAGFRDYDNDNKLEYSLTRDVAGKEELPTLQMWIRVDDPDRTYAGELLRDEMLKQKIPLDAHIADRSICYYHAWVAYDYHIYTGGWSWGREPDMYYDLFHSDKDIYPSGGADNYVRYHSKELDPVAATLKEAPDEAAAKIACDQAQVIAHRDVAAIPLYTFAGYLAHRTNYGAFPGEANYAGRRWEGFTNEFGSAFYSAWNPLNAYPQGFDKGGTFRQGLLVDIEKWSACHAEWFYDWLVLDQIYDELLVYDPCDASKYTTMLADSYEVLTWDKGGETCTKLRFKLRPNVLFHDDHPLTAEDVAFSFQYLKDQVSVAWYWAVIKFDHATVVDPLTVDIYYDCLSVWALSWAMVPIIPKHIWEGKDASVWNPEDHDAVIGSGPFMCVKDGVVGRPDAVRGEYVHLTANPIHYRAYLWPDVCDINHTPGEVDNLVDLQDYMEILKPGNMFASENADGTWNDPPGDWGEHCDVNKDGRIGVTDVMQVGVKLGETWPQAWYLYP